MWRKHASKAFHPNCPRLGLKVSKTVDENIKPPEKVMWNIMQEPHTLDSPVVTQWNHAEWRNHGLALLLDKIPCIMRHHCPKDREMVYQTALQMKLIWVFLQFLISGKIDEEIDLEMQVSRVNTPYHENQPTGVFWDDEIWFSGGFDTRLPTHIYSVHGQERSPIAIHKTSLRK